MDFALAKKTLLVRNAPIVILSIMDFQIVKVGYNNNYLSYINPFAESILLLKLLECTCNLLGSEDNKCNVESGHCYCKEKFINGHNCEKCIDGYFSFPNCQGIIFPQSNYINLIKRKY